MVTLLSEVARNYIILRGQQHELAIVEDNVVSQEDTLKLTKSKFEAGIATDLDVARQEAQVESTRSTIPTIQTQIQQSIHRLSVLLDQPPAALEEELAEPGPLPSGPSIVPPGLPSDLIRRRPDVRQAERLLAEATANIGVAVADLFPKFNLTGNTSASKASPSNTSLTAAASPGLSAPRFNGKSSVPARSRPTSASKMRARRKPSSNIAKPSSRPLSDVEDAAGRPTTRSRPVVNRSNAQPVEANRRATDLARQLNQAGVVDFLNVLTAQLSLYVSEDQLAESEQTVGTNLIALYKALGGGWETTDPLLEQRSEQAQNTH